MTALSQAIEAKIKLWSTHQAIDQADRTAIEELVNSNSTELEDAFYKDLEFGTGGIRGVLGLGPNRMNKYNIQRATQAFANALTESFQDNIKMVIGYDSRRFSKEFAQYASQVLAANGIKVFLFDHITPTPVLSYGVRYFNAQGGIMITASHNPREYNGYKAYWADGCQVTPPNDQRIINEYQKLQDFSQIKIIDFQTALGDKLIEYIDSECENKYYKMILDQSLNPELCKTKGKNIKIAFTPLHGTGGLPIKRALEQLGITDTCYVASQFQPDGDFPTVSPPNPEEPEAMKEVIKLMHRESCDLAMATDPDTDRVGLVVNHKDRDVFLTGNQIGLLMLHYILNHKKDLGKNPLFIKTIVTSDLQEQLAKKFNVKVENTLTGFKWICGMLKDYEDKNKPFDFVFATEESFGYLTHTQARDKDAVNSCALCAEIALYYKEKGLNLVEALNEIYLEHGYSYEKNISINYLGKSGAEKIQRIMTYFRESDSPFEDVEKVKDYQSSTIKSFKDNSTENFDFTKSNVLGFYFKNGDKLYLRPSGTEPKIKFYIMIQVNENIDLHGRKNIALERASSLEINIRKMCDSI